MTTGFADLWYWRGTISRGRYAAVGISALVVKFLVDWSVALGVFHRAWMPWSYWLFPMRSQMAAMAPRAVGDSDAVFAVTMLAIAIPFIWLGVTLTVQRLRDAGQPLWLVVLFFVPIINTLFFLLLCVVEAHPRAEVAQAAPWPETRALDSWIPRSKLGAGLVAILVTAAVGLVFTLLSTQALKTYGAGLFVALPFCLGLFSVLVYSYHEPRSYFSCLTVSLVPVAVVGALLLVVAIEGLICILMAAPFATALSALGGALGYAIQVGYWRARQAPAMLSIVLLFAPGFSGVERVAHLQPQTFVVKSAIEVNAAPEKVWKEVVSFGEIAPPKEMIFRAGIAYPIRAEMIGSGAGAVRHCVFSTGQFVEPIYVWDAPRLLKFGVSENPPPMREITPYASIEPAHLHGYFVSHQGQFLLTALPGGRTRLEGTTWYSHTIWPEAYWHLWSDYIVHRIHMRVLEHIKSEVER
ncbi:MAG TPA: DUF805 domain-containing protein [Candidatus Dormibacteraeota bacterium]|nr:DUF805 domain-containing protein [Candidatus Dormibacteraeota bacterium]